MINIAESIPGLIEAGVVIIIAAAIIKVLLQGLEDNPPFWKLYAEIQKNTPNMSFIEERRILEILIFFSSPKKFNFNFIVNVLVKVFTNLLTTFVLRLIFLPFRVLSLT